MSTNPSAGPRYGSKSKGDGTSPVPKSSAKNSLGNGSNVPSMHPKLASAATSGSSKLKISGIQLGNHKHSSGSDGFQQHSL